MAGDATRTLATVGADRAIQLAARAETLAGTIIGFGEPAVVLTTDE